MGKPALKKVCLFLEINHCYVIQLVVLEGSHDLLSQNWLAKRFAILIIELDSFDEEAFFVFKP